MRGATPSMFGLAGLLAWVAVGAAATLEAVSRGQLPPLLLALPWLAFAPAFWLLTASPGPEPGPGGSRRSTALLVVQSVCALLFVRFGGNGFDGVLLTVVAGQLPFVLSRRASWSWVLAQGALQVAALLGAGWHRSEALLNASSYLAFQAFAVAAAQLAVSEARARAELARAHAELLATRHLLEEATRQGERLRISRDLHDTAGHHLAALSLQLELASHLDGTKAKAAVQQAQAISRELFSEVRATVSALRDQGALDLRPALLALAQGAVRPQITFVLPDELSLHAPDRAQALLRCVQEIVTNAVRHSGARTLSIELSRGEGGLLLSARDDGRGAAAVRPGNGLTGMRERLEQLGGRLEISSSAGTGFSLRAVLPEPGWPGPLA